MGWERGRYYTRSHKVNGRVLREYVGGGLLGKVAAELDEANRLQREQVRLRKLHVRDELDDLDADVADLDADVATIHKMAMYAAGLHQHDRGQWRKRREGRG